RARHRRSGGGRTVAGGEGDRIGDEPPRAGRFARALRSCRMRQEDMTMAGRPKDSEIGLAPDSTSAVAEYERDFYSWMMEQARHVREARWDAVDRENLAEEIESLGREQFSKLESAIRVLMMHMLKWDHRPQLWGRSWWASISEQRLRLNDILEDNPGLRPRIEEAITRAYR